MARKQRVTLGFTRGVAAPPRLGWLDNECDQLVRNCRKAASQCINRPDPFGIRDAAKLAISRIRILLAHARKRPELAHTLWNALMLGQAFTRLRFVNNWGDQLVAAKQQRDGALSGREHAAQTRKERAEARAQAVLLEAHRGSRRRKVSQRAFALQVALRLNEAKPRPKPLYTADSVRSILLEQHFFESR